MPPRKNRPSGPTPVEAFKHEDKRVNIPTADSSELVSPDVAQPTQLRYPRNPDLDPQLVWTGKDAQDGEDLVVDAPPIYIQEKIVPRVIIENLRKVVEKPQLSLFEEFDGLEGYEAVEYYQHEANWSNRMILGDSLQVMASLAEKENLRGKVQMIYIDPPYGIKLNSNWQVRTDKRSVTDGSSSGVTRQVEQIKAFRDTWEGGISTYLAYLRDRLIVARDLLTDSGSIFVQIGDENVHLVRSLLDEVFGSHNLISRIAYGKTSGQTNVFISGTLDYILWRAKDVESVKFRRLFKPRELGGQGSDKYDQVELPDGSRIPESKAKASGVTGRYFRLDNLTSESAGRAKGEGAASWFKVRIDGRDFTPTLQTRWKTNEQGMENLLLARRVQVTKNTLAYVRYHDDFPAFAISNPWTDIGGIQSRADTKIYVVQTSTAAVQRCMLMTTDPGDLVLDPTCGSGTTAVVAEHWGRRWITIDTSRVALTLARQRLMTSQFPYYKLADPHGDVRKGLVYKRIPHVTHKSIATNPEIKAGMNQRDIEAAILRHADAEVLYDQAEEDTKKVRVSGPFTVESLSPHATVTPVRSRSEKAATVDDASVFEKSIIDLNESG